MKIQSEYERWLLAMIAGPVSGMFSAPTTIGRKMRLTGGPTSTFFSTQ